MTSKEIQILSNYAAKERARIQLEIESTLKKGCDIANANKLMQLCDSRFFVGQITELLKSLTPDDCPKAVFQPSLSPETAQTIRDALGLYVKSAELCYPAVESLVDASPFFGPKAESKTLQKAKDLLTSAHRALDEFNAVYPEKSEKK